MIERITERPEGCRFLGDEAEMIVHDLRNEDATEQGGSRFSHLLKGDNHALGFRTN